MKRLTHKVRGLANRPVERAKGHAARRGNAKGSVASRIAKAVEKERRSGGTLSGGTVLGEPIPPRPCEVEK